MSHVYVIKKENYEPGNQLYIADYHEKVDMLEERKNLKNNEYADLESGKYSFFGEKGRITSHGLVEPVAKAVMHAETREELTGKVDSDVLAGIKQKPNIAN